MVSRLAADSPDEEGGGVVKSAGAETSALPYGAWVLGAIAKGWRRAWCRMEAAFAPAFVNGVLRTLMAPSGSAEASAPAVSWE